MAKKPKKPKAKASLASWQRYHERITKFHSDKKKKETLMHKYRH